MLVSANNYLVKSMTLSIKKIKSPDEAGILFHQKPLLLRYNQSSSMVLFLLCTTLGLISSLVTYFLTPLSQNPYYIFLLLVFIPAYGTAAFLLFASILALCCPFIRLDKEVKHPHWFAYWAICQVIWMVFFYLGVNVHVNGKEKLPNGKRFLLVSNHRSNFDFLCVMAKLPSMKVIPIAKKETEDYFVAGKWSHLAGFIPLDRSDAYKGLKAIIKAINYVKGGEASIYVAPEGTRSKNGKMGEFHAGSFKIAEKSKCPIVIACIANTEKIRTRYFRGITNVYFDIVDVIDSDKVAAMNTIEMADYSKTKIQEHLDRYHKEETTNA